jgi:uncharacterized repeat protein (TIGR03803 family)
MKNSITYPVAKLGLHRWVLGAAFAVLLGGPISVGQSPQLSYNYTILYDFCSLQNCADGLGSSSPLVEDAKGNLYGTADNVFKLTPRGKETVLYTFTDSSNVYPIGNIVRDSAGNLYGTTEYGGDIKACDGCGTVWKVNASGKGTVLYRFKGGSDGMFPYGGVIRDSAGNLYGTTAYGGDLNADCGVTGWGCGTVFKLDKAGKKTILHSFGGGADYGVVWSGLVMDNAGNLYGTTYGNGTDFPGTVYKVTRAGKEKVLYTFKNGNDGCNPLSTLILDAKGNLYGTTSGAANCNLGTVFKLTPKGKETVLHDFQGPPLDGADPYAGVIMDSAGNLYGTTKWGGVYDCPAFSGGCGTVFKISKDGNETVLYKFKDGSDGGFPTEGLSVDANGGIYGTTPQGGYSIYCNNGGYGCGVVFKITP